MCASPFTETTLSLPPTSVQGAVVTQRQQSERRLTLGEAQRESSNPTPSYSPRTEGSDGRETKAGPLLASVQEALLFVPVLLPKSAFLPAVQQLCPCWWCWMPPCWHMTAWQGSHSASAGVRTPVDRGWQGSAVLKQHTSSVQREVTGIPTGRPGGLVDGQEVFISRGTP